MMQRAEKKKAFIESRLLSKTDIDELRLPDELSEFNDQLKRLSEATDSKSKRRLKVIHTLITNNLTNGDPLERPRTIDRIKRTFTDEIKNDNNFGHKKMENNNTTKKEKSDKKPLIPQHKNEKPRNDKSQSPLTELQNHYAKIEGEINAITNREKNYHTDSEITELQNLDEEIRGELDALILESAITTPESSHHREINHHTDSDTDTDPDFSASSLKKGMDKAILHLPHLNTPNSHTHDNFEEHDKFEEYFNAFPPPAQHYSEFSLPQDPDAVQFPSPEQRSSEPQPQHQIIKKYEFSTVNNVDLFIQRIDTWIKSQKNFVLICKDKFYLMNRDDFVDTNDIIMRANWAFFNYKFHRLILPDETSDMNYVLNQTDVENIKKGKDLFYELVRFKQINTVDQKWKEFRDNYRTLQKLQNPDWKSSTASTGAFNVNTTFRRRRRPHNPSTVNTDLRDKSTLLLQMQQFLDSHSSKHNITNVENITEAQVQKLRQVNACLLARVESVPRTYLEYLLETKGKRPRSKWWLRLTRRLRSNLKTYGGGRGRGGRGRTKKRLHYR